MITRDPLYWGLILFAGLFSGIFAYHLDRQHKQMGALCFALYLLASLLGAVVGAYVLAPVLQVVENFVFRWSSAEIKWPYPVSVQGHYVFVGVVAGTAFFNTVARLFCRGAGSR